MAITKLGYITPVRTCDICVKDPGTETNSQNLEANLCSALREENVSAGPVSGLLPAEIIAQWSKLCLDSNDEVR